MNIFEQVKSLGLPLGQYLVVGSGPLAARGLRDFKDIDILVTSDLYEGLKSDGWVENSSRPDLIYLERGIFGLGKTMVTTPGYKPNIEGLISDADIINGVPFMRLEDLMLFKQSLGRPKDLVDIELIKEYLKK